jgi:flagellar basal body P-ring protein FlgI
MVVVSVVMFLAGCSGMAIRSQSPESSEEKESAGTRLVGDVAVAFGMHPLRVENVGLITGLAGTGSDPGPSPQRSALLAEMQKLGVINPNQVLASSDTDLVVVQGYLRPGIQKGDRFDIELRVPARSENASLRGGWLMRTRLSEMAVLGGVIRPGNLLAVAEGAVLIDPTLSASGGAVREGRGRVLGGGVALTSRELGLALKPDHQNVLTSAKVGAAVNRRFHLYKNGVKEGVARPKTDEFILLTVHPRYKENVERYIRVIRALPLNENTQQQLARVQLLERQLQDPITASMAALRLEALGKDGIAPLKSALASPEIEVRFYAAEALAYLDQPEAAETLGQIAREVPAFRAFALAALSAMDEFPAYEALRSLLSASSAETRYGAFRSLWAMNADDPLVRGERLGDQFHYHVLATDGPHMVHVTRSRRPEVVLFGHPQRLTPPFVLEAGPSIMVKSTPDGQVSVSRFALDEPDQQRVVSTTLDDVIRAIVDVGGTYPDVVQCLQEAKLKKALEGRFEVDAVPGVGRTYYRDGGDGTEEEPEVVVNDVAHPLPRLFQIGRDEPERRRKTPPSADADDETPQKTGPIRGLFGKMSNRET